MIYPIYVMSHSDVFREGLNAVAAFCHSRGFQAATWVGSAIGIIVTAMAYLKRHDVMVYLRWLVTYCLVFQVLLGIPSKVAIHNMSDQTVPPQVVDNVPFGIAFPAYIMTSIGYGFTVDMETVFALPEEVQYHQTGMLFGSHLFRLSLAATIDDRALTDTMNQYVKNCVIGDVLINHKYTWDQLVHSNNLWELMSRHASPIRGLFWEDQFVTCQEASQRLTQEINGYASTRAPGVLSSFIPSQNHYSTVAMNRLLVSSYGYFTQQSQSAMEILRQNLAINLFRSAVHHYAMETGSLTSLPVMANTEAMGKMRMAWGTSRHIGIQTLPLMQVVLLLLLLCLFPLVAMLTLLPTVGMGIVRQYVYSLLWLESWPMLYAILNMAMNVYLHGRSVDSVTLSSVNALAQSHSDIAGIAGYLVLAIPFLSLGIVRGMAFTFNNAAQYLGGMMHSIAQSSGGTVAMGNYSLGNVSSDNATANTLNANKHDTNVTNFQGLQTEQLGNGATITSTPTGDRVVNITPAMSQLATSPQAAHSASESLSHQVDRALNSAKQYHTQYANTRGDNHSWGQGFSSSDGAQVDQAMSTINGITQQVAEREHANSSDSFQKLTKASLSGGLTGSLVLGNFLKHPNVSSGIDGASANVSGGINGTAEGVSTHQGGYSQDVNRDLSTSEAKNFNEALSTVKHYSETHSVSDQNSDANNLVIQTGVELTKAERLSHSAQFIESHAQSINTNFSQAFARFVQETQPDQADMLLSATNDATLLAQQEALANHFIQTHAASLSGQFAAQSRDIQQSDDVAIVSQSEQTFMERYRQQSADITDKHRDLGRDFMKENAIKDEIQQHLQRNKHTLQQANVAQTAQINQLRAKESEQMDTKERYAKAGLFHHILNSRGLDK